ncbi:hypothetical protein IFM89_010811 [Coptis chinensis]|uniref:rRNA-processing protein FYV7 n=1 Tax=Coptis chinensis TaxID=261450 RepID=A0A835M8C8_9MAGN|nr:hypothetical protein IFM89_010811 [Coptis chinensis]
MTKKNTKDNHSEENRGNMKNSKSVMMNKKNQKRLGGGGLSLAAFANAKSRNNNYNPALIKKQREFYKNSKCVNKYKKSLKQQSELQNSPSVAMRILEEEETKSSGNMDKKSKKKNKQSVEKLCLNKRQEEEKARLEKEASFQTKKEARERTEAQRKELRSKMYKKTKFGQPVMKYRIEHLLESIQGSNK